MRAVTKTGTTTDDRAHLWPQVLPGGKALLFTVWTGASFNDARIEAVSLESGARTVLVRGGTHGRFVPTGHLVYSRGGTLFAVRFDPRSLEITGDPVQVVEGVATGAANGEARFDFSSTGTLIYAQGEFTAAARNLVWVDRSGKVVKITDGEFTVTGPMATGVRVRMSRTAVLDTGAMQIVVSERRAEPSDLGVFTHAGLDPRRKRYVLIKSRQHFRAGFEPIARHIVLCDGDGVTSSDLSLFD